MSDDESTDPDRAAILARRRRFVALAISGLATSACPQPCLSIGVPEEGGEAEGGEAGAAEAGAAEAGEAPPSATGPIVEDPGAPVGGDTGETGDTGAVADTGGPPDEPKPHACLRMRPKPQPCLMIMKR